MDISNLWSCGRNQNVVLWDITEGSPKKKKTFPIDDYLGFSRCDVAEDSMLLSIPGPSQDTITLWDIKSEKRISCLIPPDKSWGSIMQCKWLQYKQHLNMLVLYENGTIALWDWSNNKILSTVTCNNNPLSIDFDSHSLRGICGTASEKVFVFAFEEVSHTLNCDTAFSITNPGLGCVSIRPDGKIYATGGWDHRIRLFSWKKHKPLAVLLYHRKSIECLAFSERSVSTFTKGYLLAAGSSDNSISLWDVYN